MDEFILIDPEDENDKQDTNSTTVTALRLPAHSIKHLDEALKEIDRLLYEDIIDLWEVYGEC